MALERVTISSDPVVDPNATPDAGITATTKGKVTTAVVDPAQAAADKAAAERPKWLPEKFKSAEDLAKAYGELETKLGVKPATQTVEQAREAVAKVGLDMSQFSKEYAEKGKLSEESLKSLETKGISRETVGAYIDGLKAMASQMRSSLAEVAGGDEQLKSLYQWAATNLSADEVKSYNSLVESNNLTGAKMMLQGMVSQFTKATGSDPDLVSAESVPDSSGVKPFASNAQVVEAMRNPKYKTDEAYRVEVARRLEKTQLATFRT